MSEQYTPTTEEVRNAFNQTSVWVPRTSFKDYGETFDRWLAAHEAQVKADYLRMLAEKYAGFAAKPEYDGMPITRLTFETVSALLSEEGGFLTPGDPK